MIRCSSTPNQSCLGNLSFGQSPSLQPQSSLGQEEPEPFPVFIDNPTEFYSLGVPPLEGHKTPIVSTVSSDLSSDPAMASDEEHDTEDERRQEEIRHRNNMLEQAKTDLFEKFFLFDNELKLYDPAKFTDRVVADQKDTWLAKVGDLFKDLSLAAMQQMQTPNIYRDYKDAVATVLAEYRGMYQDFMTRVTDKALGVQPAAGAGPVPVVSPQVSVNSSASSAASPALAFASSAVAVSAACLRFLHRCSPARAAGPPRSSLFAGRC